MSKEQIEEMKQDINTALARDCSNKRCLTCEFINEENCEPSIISEHLYNAGYRKQREVREIFDEIEAEIVVALENNQKRFQRNTDQRLKDYVQGKIHALREIDDFIEELKKKYTEQKECTTCKHFVGCEKAVWTGVCDEHEVRNG